jgi:hypothetical protein
MTFQHLPDNPRDKARSWNIPLGVPGFRYADLNRVRRLEALDRAFLATLDEADPGLTAELTAYRAGARLEKLDEPKLLMRVAPILGRFLARLFGVEPEYEALCARVRADEVLSQWKRAFVERRVFKETPAPGDLEAVDVAVLESAYRAVVDAVQPDAALSADPERELAELTIALQEATAQKREGAEGERSCTSLEPPRRGRLRRHHSTDLPGEPVRSRWKLGQKNSPTASAAETVARGAL